MAKLGQVLTIDEITVDCITKVTCSRIFSYNYIELLNLLKEQTDAKEPFYGGASYWDDQGAIGGMQTAEVCRRHGSSPATLQTELQLLSRALQGIRVLGKQVRGQR